MSFPLIAARSWAGTEPGAGPPLPPSAPVLSGVQPCLVLLFSFLSLAKLTKRVPTWWIWGEALSTPSPAAKATGRPRGDLCSKHSGLARRGAELPGIDACGTRALVASATMLVAYS